MVVLFQFLPYSVSDLAQTQKSIIMIIIVSFIYVAPFPSSSEAHNSCHLEYENAQCAVKEGVDTI